MAINFYKHPKVQKHLEKFQDNQVQYTGMGLRRMILVTGSTGSGKSNAICQYIYLSSKGSGSFKHIFVLYKTNEPLYDFLKEQLKEKISFYQNINEFPDVDKFADNPKENYLVIFDDVVQDKDKKTVEKINKFYTYGRKKGLTCIYLSQSFFDTPSFIRKQISYLILCSIRGRRDLNMILKEYSNLNLTSDQLFEVYRIATEKENDDDLPFLKITTFTVPKDQKFSRNFTDYIPISQLFPSEDDEE